MDQYDRTLPGMETFEGLSLFSTAFVSEHQKILFHSLPFFIFCVKTVEHVFYRFQHFGSEVESDIIVYFLLG